MSGKGGYHWAPRPWAPSEMEERVLDGVARGLTNAEIAAEVGISPDGVKWHVSRALAETGLEDRRALALWWQSPRPDVRMSLRTRPAPVTLEYREPPIAVPALLHSIGRSYPFIGRSVDEVTSSQGATRGKVRYS